MVRVWFGDRKNAIYNTSVFFKNRYKDEWITDPFAREVIHDVDRSEVIDSNDIDSTCSGKDFSPSAIRWSKGFNLDEELSRINF